MNKTISKDEYLTQNTAEGLRVTLKSTIELSKYLLEQCGFKYILTCKMNQDRLEVIGYIITNLFYFTIGIIHIT